MFLYQKNGLKMVEEKINEWILQNFGELSTSVKRNVSNTFELYWDQFNFRYAEIKTLEIYKHLK